MEDRPANAEQNENQADLLPPTEYVIADLVRAFDSSWRMDLGLSAAALHAVTKVEAVYQLLVQNGILSEEDLDERVEALRPMVKKAFEDEGIFIHRPAPGVDKYEMKAMEAAGDVDCENRIHLCHGACCTLDFTLTEQDVNEGIVQWELEDPYAIRQGDSGHCVHQNAQTRMCTVYKNRPAACRVYSCKNDPRIWADFENYVISPDLDAHLAERRRERSHVELGPPRRRRVEGGVKPFGGQSPPG